MFTVDALKVYGSKKAIADALGISPSAVYMWDWTDEGLVPPVSAARLAKRNKKLKFDPDTYIDWNRKTGS